MTNTHTPSCLSLILTPGLSFSLFCTSDCNQHIPTNYFFPSNNWRASNSQTYSSLVSFCLIRLPLFPVTTTWKHFFNNSYTDTLTHSLSIFLSLYYSRFQSDLPRPAQTFMFWYLSLFHHQPGWPVKSRQMSIKAAQNDSTRNVKDFDIFTKIA